MYTIESSADYGYQSTDDGQEKNLNDADEPSQRAVHQSTSTQSITSSTLTSLPTIISTPVNPVIDVSSDRGSAYFSNIVPLGTTSQVWYCHISGAIPQIFFGCFGLRILDHIAIIQVASLTPRFIIH